VRIGALVVAGQPPGRAKGDTSMLIEASTEDAWKVIARRAERSTSSQHAHAKVDPIEARNRNPAGTAETSGFVAETPSDCRLRCRNPRPNGGGFGNADRAMYPASMGVLGG